MAQPSATGELDALFGVVLSNGDKFSGTLKELNTIVGGQLYSSTLYDNGLYLRQNSEVFQKIKLEATKRLLGGAMDENSQLVGKGTDKFVYPQVNSKEIILNQWYEQGLAINKLNQQLWINHSKLNAIHVASMFRNFFNTLDLTFFKQLDVLLNRTDIQREGGTAAATAYNVKTGNNVTFAAAELDFDSREKVWAFYNKLLDAIYTYKNQAGFSLKGEITLENSVFIVSEKLLHKFVQAEVVGALNVNPIKQGLGMNATPSYNILGMKAIGHKMLGQNIPAATYHKTLAVDLSKYLGVIVELFPTELGTTSASVVCVGNTTNTKHVDPYNDLLLDAFYGNYGAEVWEFYAERVFAFKLA